MPKPKDPNFNLPDNLDQRGKAAAEAVLALLRAKRRMHSGGCRVFYSPEQWRERGEEYGRESLLIIVHDGGDHAGFFNWSYEEPKAIEAMRAALESAGCYVEQCTSWYSAVYPL